MADATNALVSLRSRAERMLVIQAVRLVEVDGPLDDAEVLRQTLAASTGHQAWLLERGWRLGRRLGFDTVLRRWRAVGAVALALLVVLVLAGAWGVAGAVVHSGRTVNAVAAFFSLLGLHGLTLLLWLIGLVAPWPSSGGALGRLWLETVARFPGAPRAQAGDHTAKLLQAAVDLLRRERLAPWLFGWISHTVWALSFVVMLAALWFAFSFQAYRLTWETTILDPGFFVRFVHLSGWLPGWLGFAVPDTATLLAPGAVGADQRAWAWWLIGCVAVYGLLPRAVLAVVCAAVWRRRLRGLALDTTDPYFRQLLARFDALQPAWVVDAEQPWRARASAVSSASAASASATDAALIGFELPPEMPWPPLALARAPRLARNIAGTADERSEVLQALRQAHPARLLIVCHAASSPDRGTERFIREASGHAGLCGLLLATALPANASAPSAATAPAAADLGRWATWVAQTGMPHAHIFTDRAAAARWLDQTEAAPHG